MGNYFLNITKQEKQNILDKHKTVYDGFVTEYGQSINNQPLYVQDFANDKNGITVSNKGVVKNYTNVNINESDFPIDNIDSKPKFKLDVRPFDSGNYEDSGDWVGELMSSDSELEEGFDDFDMKHFRDGVDYSEEEFPPMNKYSKKFVKRDLEDLDYFDSRIDRLGDGGFNEYDFYSELDEEEESEVKEKIEESLNMFKRFKKYN
jgi:hypothetical protein